MLELSDVHTYYGESHVLQGLTLSVRPGEIVTILGRNGMGKTTVMRSIVGFTPARRGRACFKGDDVTRWQPFRMVEHGMALVPQGRPGPHPEPRPDRALVGSGGADGERNGQGPLSRRRLERRRGPRRPRVRSPC